MSAHAEYARELAVNAITQVHIPNVKKTKIGTAMGEHQQP